MIGVLSAIKNILASMFNQGVKVRDVVSIEVKESYGSLVKAESITSPGTYYYPNVDGFDIVNWSRLIIDFSSIVPNSQTRIEVSYGGNNWIDVTTKLNVLSGSIESGNFVMEYISVMAAKVRLVKVLTALNDEINCVFLCKNS